MLGIQVSTSHIEQAVNFTPGAGSRKLCTHTGSKRDSVLAWQTALVGKAGCSYTRRKVSSKKPSNAHQSSEVTLRHTRHNSHCRMKLLGELRFGVALA